MYNTKAAIGSEDRTGPLNSIASTLTTWAQNVFARTILARMPGVASVPFATLLARLTTSTRAGFVGESVPAPVSKPAFAADATLESLKIVGLTVTSQELLEDSNAEQILDRDLGGALVLAADRVLLDAGAAVGEVRPASILHGLSALDASGADTAGDVDAVAGTLIATLITAGSDLSAAVFVTTPTIALAISLMRSGGVPAFPGVTANGGILGGLPLITSVAAPASQLSLIDASQVFLARAPDVEFSTSSDTMIDMSSVPAGSTRTSMFQEDSVALKAIQRINWSLARPFAAYATGFAPALPSLGSP
jgi:HK97 family phage major capsid protein